MSVLVLRQEEEIILPVCSRGDAIVTYFDDEIKKGKGREKRGNRMRTAVGIRGERSDGQRLSVRN